MASANSLPNTPLVCRASASVPAMGPKPAEIRSKAAHTNSGMARRALSNQRVGLRNQAESWDDMRLAGTAIAKPSIAAIAVPNADMARVSQAPQATLFTNTGDRSGGKNSATKRPMLRAASIDTKAAQSSSRDTKLATTNTSKPAVNQQARQRALNRRGGSFQGGLATSCAKIRGSSATRVLSGIGVLMPRPFATTHSRGRPRPPTR